MNYIELINNFWQANKEHCFTGNETALYFYLLHTCNSLGWKNPFKHSNGHITGMLGMSEKTLNSSRNRLSQAGLIEFNSGSGRRALSSYSIKGVNIPTFRAEKGSPFGGDFGDLSGENTPDNIKLNKTKLKEGDDDAGASAPVKKESTPPKSKTSKKEKPPGCAAPPSEEPGHQEFVDAYHEWYTQLVGSKPRLFEADYKALKSIRRYLADVAEGNAEKALQSWLYILKHWAKLEDFLRRQVKPTQIDSNMVNILAQLRTSHQSVTKNGRNQGNNFNNGSKQPYGESLEQIEARYS